MATISADIYFDSVNGNDLNDGSSPALAKQSIAYFQHANNHLVNAGVTIYLANGSEWNVTDEIGSENRLHYRGNGTKASPITVTNYTPSTGATTRPKLHNYTDIGSGDWVNAGGGDWTYTVDVNIVNLGSFPNIGIFYGADVDTPLTKDLYTISGTTLTVTSGGSDPTTTWGTFRLCYQPVFYQFNDTGAIRGGRVYHGIDCTYAFALVSIYTTTAGAACENNEFYDLNISYCGYGIVSKNGNTAGSTVTANVHGCTIHHIGGAGVGIEGPKNINWIVDGKNNISHCCLQNGANGFGGVAINGNGNTATSNNLLVEDNDISYCVHGRGTTTFDGAGIYAETGCTDSLIQANRISYCHHAIQDNTGENLKVYGNDINHCDIGIVQTDQAARGNVDADYSDNCFRNMTYTALEYDPSATSPLTAIVSIVSNGAFKLKNNVFHGASGTTDDGLRINTAATQTIDETNNGFEVGGDDIINTGGTPQASDATDVSGDLKISSNGVGLADSPLIGAGIKHWSGPNPNTTAQPKSDIDTDIGLQSTYSPFHPVKL
jgi:hypothetical protein